jgi:anti-sigma regulatory factor (Ser/Thr protein kinase)
MAGLSEGRTDDLVTAVNEIASNAIIHGGGEGLFRIVHAHDGLHIELSDHGPGPAGPPTLTPNMHVYPSDALSGRGLCWHRCYVPVSA